MKESLKEKQQQRKDTAAAPFGIEETAASDALRALGFDGGGIASILGEHDAGHVLRYAAVFGDRARAGRNPCGFFRRALSWDIPEDYVAAERKQERTTAHKEQERMQQDARTREYEAQEHWTEEVDGHAQELDQETREDLREAARTRAQETFGDARETFVQICFREVVAEHFGMPLLDEYLSDLG